MTHTQHVARYGNAQFKRFCDCGRPATHRNGGGSNWECDECKRLNKIASEILLPYVGSSEHGQRRK